MRTLALESLVALLHNAKSGVLLKLLDPHCNQARSLTSNLFMGILEYDLSTVTSCKEAKSLLTLSVTIRSSP